MTNHLLRSFDYERLLGDEDRLRDEFDSLCERRGIAPPTRIPTIKPSTIALKRPTAAADIRLVLAVKRPGDEDDDVAEVFVNPYKVGFS